MSAEKPHRARKRFGQNFLHDDHVIQKIISAINPGENDHLIEIGPGKGAMTTPLLKRHKQLTAIEVDNDLAKHLQLIHGHNPDFTLVNQDVLSIDFGAFAEQGKHLSILGNLPYNISTPLIFHLLQYHPIVSEMVFMLQLEVVNRICALPNEDDYGRLSIMTQYYCNAEKLFIVPPGAFNPPPKVYSAIIKLTPHKELPYPANNATLLADVVREAFNQRRKTIRNSLKRYISADELQHLDINPQLRPENLSLQDYVKISNALTKPN